MFVLWKKVRFPGLFSGFFPDSPDNPAGYLKRKISVLTCMGLVKIVPISTELLFQMAHVIESNVAKFRKVITCRIQHAVPFSMPDYTAYCEV